MARQAGLDVLYACGLRRSETERQEVSVEMPEFTVLW